MRVVLGSCRTGWWMIIIVDDDDDDKGKREREKWGWNGVVESDMIPVKGKEAPIPGDILKAAASQGGNSPEITKMERGELNGNVIEEIFGLMNERVS